MAFRKKHAEIIAQNPDLLIVIECEQEDKLKEALEDCNYKEILWFGDNPHKGIALIRFSDFGLELVPNYSEEYKYVLPLQMKAKKIVNLFVIWAMPHETMRQRSYVGQIWAAVHYYEKLLGKDSILIGDFNSNSIWDHTRKKGHHGDLVDFLNKKGIYSLYHIAHDEEHGTESKATQYMYRHEDKPYHLDYCFASQTLISNKTSIEVGQYDDWIGLSDHMPLTVDKLQI